MPSLGDMTLAEPRTFAVPQERRVVTALPGPNSLALQARRLKSVSRGAGTLANIYMDRGAGAILVDVDGNHLIDLGCGIGVTTIGHAHPAVTRAPAGAVRELLPMVRSGDQDSQLSGSPRRHGRGRLGGW